MNTSDSRSDARYSSGQDQGPSVKIMMGTLRFRNVVTPACRQIPDRPSVLSLHGRAGLYLLDIFDSLYY